MSSIIRHDPASLLTEEPIPGPLCKHETREVKVETQLTLGREPSINIRWRVDSMYWSDGYRLLGYRSTSGFSADPFPEELNSHGQLIIEARENDFFQQYLAEGTYYYTFLLYKQDKRGWQEKLSEPVRFSAEVPTAKIALGRIKDQIEFIELQDEAITSRLERKARRSKAQFQRHINEAKLIESKKPKQLPKPPPEKHHGSIKKKQKSMTSSR